jgi:hypothetical protein
VAFPFYKVSATSTAVAVDPLLSIVNLGDTFNVNVNVTDIANFTSWQLNLYYFNSVLNCTNAVEGPFLLTGGTTFFRQNITNSYNATHGLLVAYSTLLGITSVNGGGVILAITFKALSEGSTNLTLANTQLGDEKIPPQPILHIDLNGVVNVIGGGHDVAVTDVVTSKTGCTPMPTVGQNLNVTVSVTLENHGSFDESTVNITAYAAPSSSPAIIIGSRIVSLQTFERSTIDFNWSTIGVAYGNYTINATASPVPGETNIADNTFTSGKIFVTIPGDINGNFQVTLTDLVLLANAYGSRPGDFKWNPNADINGNGVVDLADLVILANHYGQHYP